MQKRRACGTPHFVYRGDSRKIESAGFRIRETNLVEVPTAFFCLVTALSLSLFSFATLRVVRARPVKHALGLLHSFTLYEDRFQSPNLKEKKKKTRNKSKSKIQNKKWYRPRQHSDVIQIFIIPCFYIQFLISNLCCSDAVVVATSKIFLYNFFHLIIT